MNSSSNSNLSDEILRRIDQTCDDFESAWKAGERPFVDDVLGDFPADAQAAVLNELLPIEIAWRQKSGETPSVDSYLFRFPELDQARLEALIGADATTGPDEQRTQTISGSELLGDLDSEVFTVGGAELSFDSLSVESAELLRDLDSLGIVDARLVLRSLSDTGNSLNDLPPEDVTSLLGEKELLTRWQIDRLGKGEPGQLVLGDYVLLDPLGKGGMGIVYRARHRRMDRLVALKTLTDRATESDDSVQRFQREVRAAARLSHPNIVAAYDAGEHDDTHYLVMELVDGIDLAKLVRQSGPLNASRAVDYVRQAATGFAYAHTQGIIHRDIKPQNLLVDRSQHVRILDMGLARLNPTNAAADPAASSGAQTELTQSGVIMGTVDFMSPEQATNTRNANEQSDIYSLGCTLYFLMTGRAMFDGETCMERLLAHHQDSRPSLVTTVSKIPSGLEEVFAKMTARQPANRYESMEEVVDALDVVQGALESSGQADSEKKNLAIASPSFEAGKNSPSVPPREATQETFITREEFTIDQSEGTFGESTVQRPASDEATKRVTIVGAVAVVFGLCVAAWTFWPEGSNEGDEAGTSRKGSGISDPSDLQPPEHLTLRPDRSQPEGDWPGGTAIQQKQRDVAQKFGITPFVENSIGMKLAVVPRDDSGGKPFLVGTTEVTIRQFGLFVDDNGDELQNRIGYGLEGGAGWRAGPEYDFRHLGDLEVSPHFPACSICWLDAQAFCQWLSEKEHCRYRLPTISEWQTANFAGSTAKWFFGDDDARLSDFAWHVGNSGIVFHEVAQKRPNALGIYDTLGNEFEWCLELPEPAFGNSGGNRVELRPQLGGGFGSSEYEMHGWTQEWQTRPQNSGHNGAFRVVREL
jgi:serine/threonine protein kinase